MFSTLTPLYHNSTMMQIFWQKLDIKRLSTDRAQYKHSGGFDEHKTKEDNESNPSNFFITI
jgi:hypothetical protein